MFLLMRQAALVFVALAVVTGVVYPLMMTGIAQIVVPHHANGSLIERDGHVIGSRLVGQHFDDARYFRGRPSTTSPPYNAGASTGSNFGPTNPAQLDAVRRRAESLRQTYPDQVGAIPVDLVTASASGLDPHISPAAADYQITRVASKRGLDAQTVRDLVSRHTAGRQLGVLGEPRVHVLELNLSLDNLAK